MTQVKKMEISVHNQNNPILLGILKSVYKDWLRWNVGFT